MNTILWTTETIESKPNSYFIFTLDQTVIRLKYFHLTLEFNLLARFNKNYFPHILMLPLASIPLANAELLVLIGLIGLPIVLTLTLAYRRRLHTGLVYYILVMIPFLIVSHMYARGVLIAEFSLLGLLSFAFVLVFIMFWESCLIKSAKDWGFADWLDEILPEHSISIKTGREKKALGFKLTRKYMSSREGFFPDLGALMNFSKKVVLKTIQRGSGSDLYIAIVPRRGKEDAIREYLKKYGLVEIDEELKATVYSTKPRDAKIIVTGDPRREYERLPNSFIIVIEEGRVSDVSIVEGVPVESVYTSAGWSFRAGRTTRMIPKAKAYRVGLYRIVPYGKEVDILKLRAHRESTYYYTDVSSLWSAVFMKTIPTIDWREWIEVPHIAIIGETGSGKSVALANIIKYLVEKGERVLVFDLNGQFYSVYEELKRNQNCVSYLDLAEDVRIDISKLPVPLTAEVITMTMRSIDLREGEKYGIALSPIAYEVLRGILQELED
ncbi:MAG: hypothetical protein DRN53_07305, partial [Thermoprotei archaeon]